ncbi:hypothetical protein HaLaN_03537 [Haematococcus lacustris]|uniref:Uncharacterized protein n=1 Tax=Haematococcus lacustris TaxID=44745 RepID=A0A699YEQ3_HAELA|nr:hypothetical protein HaLaN_03537 [Haematococcus lacustris]
MRRRRAARIARCVRAIVALDGGPAWRGQHVSQGVRQHQGGVAPGHQSAVPHCAPSRAEPAAAAASAACGAQGTWSLEPAAPGYIIKWLVTAEQLQLDALKEAALEGLKKQPDQRLKRQLATKAMHADLLRLSPELMLEAWRVVAEAKICSACVRDCTCEEKPRYADICHKCGKRSRCGYCGQHYWR